MSNAARNLTKVTIESFPFYDLLLLNHTFFKEIQGSKLEGVLLSVSNQLEGVEGRRIMY